MLFNQADLLNNLNTMYQGNIYQDFNKLSHIQKEIAVLLGLSENPTKAEIISNLNSFYQSTVYSDFNKVPLEEIRFSLLMQTNMSGNSPPPVINLIADKNPGFEDGLINWNTYAVDPNYTFTLSSPGFEGNNSLVFGVSDYSYIWKFANVIIGENYTLGCWCKNTNNLATFMYVKATGFFKKQVLAISSEYAENKMNFIPTDTNLELGFETDYRNINYAPTYIDKVFLIKE